MYVYIYIYIYIFPIPPLLLEDFGQIYKENLITEI